MTSMSRSTKVTILLLHFTYSDTMYWHDRVRHPHKHQFPRICITPTVTSDKNKVTGPHGKALLCTKTFRPMQNIITIYSIHSIFFPIASYILDEWPSNHKLHLLSSTTKSSPVLSSHFTAILSPINSLLRLLYTVTILITTYSPKHMFFYWLFGLPVPNHTW